MLDLCRSLDGLPLAIELAAARTKTLSIEEITRRLDDRFAVLSDPTSRRPERRRSLKSTIRWSYDLLFPDDQRGLWALATFAGGAPLPAVEFVLEALDVPAAAAIDVVGRLASRSLVIVDDDAASLPMTSGSGAAGGLGALPAAGQHPGVRARGDDRRRADRPRASPRTPHGSPRPPSPPPRVCAAVARPSTCPSPGPNAPTSTPRWPGAPRTTRCSRSASSTGSVGPGSSSATAEARNGSWPRSTRPATPRRPEDRASALLLAAWIEASTGRPRARPRPHRRGHRAGRRDRRRRPAGALLVLPRLRRVASRRVPSGDGAHRSQPRALRRAGPAVGPGRELALRRPGRDLRR